MKREYQEALAEVDEILQIMPIDLFIKIPYKFVEMVSENKAKDYNVEIEEPINEENLKEETKAILGLIYRDFLASPEEREKLQKKDAEEVEKFKKEMEEQANIETIFKNRKKIKKQQINSENATGITIYKEPGLVKKFFNLIRGFFRKNKF